MCRSIYLFLSFLVNVSNARLHTCSYKNGMKQSLSKSLPLSILERIQSIGGHCSGKGIDLRYYLPKTTCQKEHWTVLW